MENTSMAVRPIPAGYHSVTPYLAVRDAVAAIDFYKRAFAAEEILRLVDPSGKIGHAEIRIGNSHVMLAEENADWDNLGPEALGGTSIKLCLYVEDADASAERAVAAGAELLVPVSDQFYGDRSGRLKDPYGHYWVVSTHKEDVSAEEMQRRFDDLFKGAG